MKSHARFRAGRRLLPALSLLMFAAACGDATPLQDFRDSNTALLAFLMGTGGPPPDRGKAKGNDEEILICPEIVVRQNEVYYDFYAPNALHDPKNVRYQAVISKKARQCDFRPDYIAIKLGFAGRVLVGPAGGPGEVTLPVRAEFAGKGDKVVWTKTYKIKVTLPPNSESQFFAHVTDDLVYQLRYGEKLDDFRIYVGFEKEDEPAMPLTSGLSGDLNPF